MPMVTQLMPALSSAARDTGHDPTDGDEYDQSRGLTVINEEEGENGEIHALLEQELVGEMDDSRAAEEWARIILNDRPLLADMDGASQEPHLSAAYRYGSAQPDNFSL